MRSKVSYFSSVISRGLTKKMKGENVVLRVCGIVGEFFSEDARH